MQSKRRAKISLYLFANGNWLKKNPIPGGYSTWGSFAVLRAQNAEIPVSYTDLTLQTTTDLKDNATHLLRDFLRAAMDINAIEKAGKNQLISFR